MSADGEQAPVEVMNEVTKNERNKFSRKDGSIYLPFIRIILLPRGVSSVEMRILGLNCQGSGNALVVHALLDVAKRWDPKVVFLSETHLYDFLAECLRRRLRMGK
jgi:hypothetical protein